MNNKVKGLLTVIAFFCGIVPTIALGQDKNITRVEIVGADIPTFQQIFIMPYTTGPRRGVQEAPGVTLNGIQDYAVTEQMAGRWKPGKPLIYNLEKPIPANITTHNPELIVSIKKLDNTGLYWTFDESKIDEFTDSNILRINLSKNRHDDKAAILASTKK